MTAALLECAEEWEEQHVRPCVTSLACWWREVRELEHLLGYARSSPAARDAWDALVASEIPNPREALYLELHTCVRAWRRISQGEQFSFPSLLDRLVFVSVVERLPLPKYGLLAAFRLKARVQDKTFANWYFDKRVSPDMPVSRWQCGRE